jgi:hypothetical protein
MGNYGIAPCNSRSRRLDPLDKMQGGAERERATKCRNSDSAVLIVIKRDLLLSKFGSV